MADNVDIKDFTAGTAKTMKSTDNAGVHTPHQIVDSISGTVTVDGSGVTQPVSAASLPLPAGAATAAKQPALGTAGTASSDVISVQGIASMTALVVDGSGVTQPVSGTVTANAGTNLNTSALAVESGGNLATLAGAVSGSEVQVDIVAALPAGTNALGTVKVTDDAGNVVDPVAQVAHDAVDSGEPHKIGFKAIAALSGATLVAAADRTDSYADLDGAQLVRPNGALGDLVSGNASNTDGTSTEVIAAAGSGVKTYLTDITLTNSSSSDITAELLDGATAKWTFPVPANGGVTHSFSSPIAGTANTAWNFDASAATDTLYCSASGFKSKI